MFDKFYTKVSNVINGYLFLKLFIRKEFKFYIKFWIIQGLKVFIINKNRLYRYYLKICICICYSYIKFKCYRNKLNYLFKLSKSNYYKEYFMINKVKIKEI